jgi:hypothetical protein
MQGFTFNSVQHMFPSSAIFDLAHIQITVKNTALIKDCQLIEIDGAI